MNLASGLTSHLEAAAVEAVPADRDSLRYEPPPATFRLESRQRVDLLTAAWNGGTNARERHAILARVASERGLPRAVIESATKVLARFDDSHQRLPTEAIENGLEALGVGKNNAHLSSGERAQLDRDGYVNLGQLLDDSTVARMRERYDQAIAHEGGSAGHEVSQTRGIGRMSGTVVKAINHDGLLDVLFAHPRLLAVTRHVLGSQFRLSSTNYHCPLPGYGQQALHADFGWGIEGRPQVVNAVWMLDDFTLENGPTRVVPGSHRSGTHPNGSPFNDGERDPYLPISDEVYTTGKAGSLMVYNAHLWHSGTQNRSTRLRRAQHVFFTRAVNPTQQDMLAAIDPGVHRRLSAAHRAILDIPKP